MEINQKKQNDELISIEKLKISEDIWWRVYDRDAGICQREGCKKEGQELHHKIFRSEGGSDDPSNLVLLCSEHHTEAHSEKKWEEYWRNWKPKKYLDIIIN